MIKLKSDYKRIIENIFSLSVVNGINYAFPLFVIPFLTRVIGIQHYGEYSYAYSVIMYFVLIVSYGFDFSATRRVAQQSTNLKSISVIFTNVISAKLLLAFFSILILLLLTFLIPSFKAAYHLYLGGIGFILGYSLSPNWLYQGFEKMRFITLTNLVSRGVTLFLLILLIKEKQDYYLINYLFGAGFLLSGIISLFFAIIYFKIGFVHPKIVGIIRELQDGWHLFLSTLFINFYRNSNIIILGALYDFKIVGIYAAAEKIIKAFQVLTNPITKTLYPYFSRKLDTGNNVRGLIEFKRILLIFSFILLVLSLFIYWGSEVIIPIYLPKEYTEAIVYIKIMSLVILFGGINYYVGVNGLVNMGNQKLFTFSVFIIGIFHIILCYILSVHFHAIGTSYSLIISEALLLFLLLFLFIKKSKEITIQ